MSTTIDRTAGRSTDTTMVKAAAAGTSGILLKENEMESHVTNTSSASCCAKSMDRPVGVRT